MSFGFTAVQLALVVAASALGIYLLAVSLGRLLKRRFGVRLGIFYQLFCVALALYLPMRIFTIQFKRGWLDISRELEAALILLGTLFLVALLNRVLWDQYFEKGRRTEVPKFLREVFALTLFAVALVVVLGVIYDQKVPGLLAGSGILAIILGLAMQDLLGNVISGIALEIGRPFRTGDWLHVDGNYGQVIDVNWRSIRLRTNDDICLDIPNNQIVRNTITNLSYPTRNYAMRLVVGIDYNAAPNTVKDILVHATQDVPGVLKNPAPKAAVRDYADSAIVYEIKFYMDNYLLYNGVRDGIYTNVWYELRRAGIKIPFPVRTLQIERTRPEAEPRSRAASALRQHATFECLNDEQIKQLVESATQGRYGRREKIIEQGSAGDSMFLLVTGIAEVYVPTPAETETLVATLRPGDCFGEMSLLTGEKRSATVIAVTDCDVLEIGKAHFADVLEQAPGLVTALGDLLARRRLETEGIVASAAGEAEVVNRRREYSASFLAKLSTYFGL